MPTLTYDLQVMSLMTTARRHSIAPERAPFLAFFAHATALAGSGVNKSRRRYDTRRPVVAANLSVLFTVHHNPAQVTFLRPARFPNIVSGMIDELQRALALAAHIVLRHGPIYAPYIDRLERELENARKNDPTERAKRILQTYTVEGGRKAIRSSHSRLCSSEGPTP